MTWALVDFYRPDLAQRPPLGGTEAPLHGGLLARVTGFDPAISALTGR